MTQQINADPRELDKFGDLAHRWWDANSEFRPLHDINPTRINWIHTKCELSGQRVLDIGCGGGLVTEALAAHGANVTGIDLSERALSVARLHLHESGHAIDYRLISAENIAAESPAGFDVVTCLEMLEHVPDPASIVQSCARLLKPGGKLFLSTINRNTKAYALAVLGAEYLLNLMPRGTHDFNRFMKPAELANFCRTAGLEVVEIVGMRYNPFDRSSAICADTDVNYLLHAKLVR